MTWDGVVPIGSIDSNEFSNAAQVLSWVMFRSFSTATFYIELRVRSAAHRITPCVRVCVVVVRSRGT